MKYTYKDSILFTTELTFCCIDFVIIAIIIAILILGLFAIVNLCTENKLDNTLRPTTKSIAKDSSQDNTPVHLQFIKAQVHSAIVFIVIDANATGLLDSLAFGKTKFTSKVYETKDRGNLLGIMRIISNKEATFTLDSHYKTILGNRGLIVNYASEAESVHRLPGRAPFIAVKSSDGTLKRTSYISSN